MYIHEKVIPVQKTSGIEYSVAKFPVQEPINYPREMNYEEAMEKYEYKKKLSMFEDVKVKNVETALSGFIMNEYVFRLNFYNAPCVTIKNTGSSYLDMDIGFEFIEGKYYPKTWAGRPDRVPETNEEMSMKVLEENGLFDEMRIKHFEIYLEDDIKDKDGILGKEFCMASIVGKIPFNEKDNFAYNDVSRAEINIYPDAIGELDFYGEEAKDYERGLIIEK